MRFSIHQFRLVVVLAVVALCGYSLRVSAQQLKAGFATPHSDLRSEKLNKIAPKIKRKLF